MGRLRGGLTSKIHTVVDRSGLPVRLARKRARGALVPPEVGINAAG
jgi:hypothetical protein